MTSLCGLIMKGLDLCAIVVVLKKDSWTFLPSNNYFSFLMSYYFLSTFKDFFYSPAHYSSLQQASVLQLCHDGHLFSVARDESYCPCYQNIFLKVFPSSHACNTLFYFFTMDIFSHTTSKHNGKAIWQRVIIFHSKMGQFCWFRRRHRQRQLFLDDNLELSGKALPFKITTE